MKLLILTSTDGTKQLVNMDLISEAVVLKKEGCTQTTSLVVASAISDDTRYISVLETPEQILALVNS